NGNFIIRTTNGGVSRVSQVSPLAGQDWNGVSFVNVQTGFIAGSAGNIIFTVNGGFQIPGAPVLTAPVNGAVNVNLNALLDWDSITTAKTYQVQIDEDTAYASPVVDSSQIVFSNINIPGGSLLNNTRYFWRVRGQSEGGIGPWSYSFSFRTIVALPNAPGLITPVNGASNVSLTPFFDWDSTSPADSYTLQAALDTSFSNAPVFISGITQSFLNLVTPQLQNNFRYYWRVSATNIAGTGPWSSIFNFTTLLGMPAAPALLSPANFATGVSLTPLLDWVEDISATSYQVQLSQDSTFATVLWDTSGFSISQVPVRTGLLTNVQTYFWRVRTTNPIGTGPWANPFRFMTLLIPPVAPVLVDPPNGAVDISTTPTLNWDSVQYAASFRVQLSTDSTFTIPNLINAGGLTFSQYNVPGGILSNNTTYYWRVNATNNAGTGPYSQVWHFHTVISPPVAAPTLLAPPNGAVNQPLNLTLDWNDVFGTAGYKLLVSSDSLFNTTLLDTTIVPSQSAMPSGLLSGSSVYYWRVRGFNVGGFGPWSVTWRFTTQVIGIEPISSIIPDRYMLYNNYPNPFNPVTTINFDIPSGVDTDVELVIYDVTGRIAAVLVNSALRPGKYSAVWNASGFASGVYFYRLSAGKFTDIKKMIVVK
ncbi:MAG TPA: T9SS type A sorting domain-containing protein, partial [Ignavibacteria bacterium]|nr:T9SS type A sorting domain-containing protein [Ignavibacteria bacterium]